MNDLPVLTRSISPSSRNALLMWVGIFAVLILFLYGIRSVLLPFVAGIAVAYFLDPAADRLERWRLPRGVAASIIIVGFMVVVGMIAVLVIPMLAQQFMSLLHALPDYVHRAEQHITEMINRYAIHIPSDQIGTMRDSLSNLPGVVISAGGTVAQTVFESGLALASLISLLLISPLVAFYLLRDWDQVTDRIDALLPRAQAPVIRAQLREMDRILAGFVRGQINVCLLLAAYYGLGFTLSGLPFGLAIGITTGLLVILPYLGFALGAGVALLVGFLHFNGLSDLVPIIIILGIGQLLESYFLTPTLVGDRVGLHPLWIIFGMLAGGALFGFVGILISVPATAVIGVLLRFAVARYEASQLYQGALKP